MSRIRSSFPGGFHEMALVLFTALGVAGGGIGAASLARAAVSWRSPYLTQIEALALSALLGIGFLISAGHLGKPLRGLLALRGFGRSALSNEVIALGVALFGGLSAVGLPPTHPLQGMVDLVAGLGAAAFLLAVGAVYHLPGRPTWRGIVVLQPLVLGTAWGLLLMVGSPEGALPGVWLRALWVTLLVDGVLVLLRNAAMERAGRVAAPSYPGAFRRRGLVMGTRLVLSALLTPLALLGGRWEIALCALSLACLLDRFGFYALALRETTESEVARVEALL